MSVYAIGDLQGCLDPLTELLNKINFDSAKDTLWFTGDLINRGPRSLDTLRFIIALGDNAVSVLGNHDLHFLAVTAGNNKHTTHDTFEELLAAPDRDELIHWLRNRPLMHYDQSRKTALIHAGLPPQWTITEAQSHASEVEEILRGDHYQTLVTTMYGNSPDHWDPALTEIERHRFIINCFTRMRYCDAKGTMDFKHKKAPGTQPRSLHPWFSLNNRKTLDTTILFGHWSTLGFRHEYNTFALDTGCLWGETLTALNIDNQNVVNVKC